MVFSEEQKMAVHFKDGPALVLAGPGSGKTTVIVNRIAVLIKEYGVEPSSILVITFTKAAAVSMKQRFLSLVGNSYVSVTFGTFHAVFFSMLRHAYNYSADSIITADTQYNYIRDMANRFELEYPDEQEMVSGIIAEISRVKCERKNINSYEATSCPVETFRIIYNKYEQMLISRRMLDYDDMILMCYELLKQRDDYRKAWQDKYEYILVDEFQDINRAQYDTIKLIAGAKANLFVVGDDDQSIYGFRGSNPAVMLGLRNDYEDVVQINLNTNYRCSSEIVSASRSLIECNRVRFMKDIKSCGILCGKITVCRVDDIEAEAIYLAAQVKALIKDGVSLSDIAVITRTNIISNIYCLKLENEGFSCKTMVKQHSIYDHWLIKDILSYFKLASGQYDRENAARIINKPTRYIKRALITQPFSYEALRCCYENDNDMLNRINDMQFDMKMLGKMPPYAAINYILKGVGYEDYIEEEISKKRLNKEEVYGKLEELKHLSRKYQDIKRFVKYINDQSNEACHLKEKDNSQTSYVNKKVLDKCEQNKIYSDEKKNAINIYTMHGCKGLEFRHVFIMDVCEGIIPYNKAVLNEEIEEERRLMYVAMTRAKEKLHLVYPVKRYGQDTTASRFIGELNPSFVCNENYCS